MKLGGDNGASGAGFWWGFLAGFGSAVALSVVLDIGERRQLEEWG